jgi:hypothetical protein
MLKDVFMNSGGWVDSFDLGKGRLKGAGCVGEGEISSLGKKKDWLSSGEFVLQCWYPIFCLSNTMSWLM